jgi:titin
VLVWTDNATNEMNFILERALDVGFTSGLTAFTIDANVTAYTDITVTAATSYWYRVRAVNLGGSSANAVAGPVTTPGLLPAAPTFLAATVSGINAPIVNLTWADNSDNETNFRIERATNANFTVGLTTFTVGAGVTAFTDTTVLPLTEYFYRVIAFNALGDSSPSNTAAILTTAVLFPTPTNLVATASAPGIFPITVSLTWTDTPNETSFIIQRATDAGFTAGLITFTVGMNVTAYTDTPVTPMTTYWYRVIALNALDSSLPSNIATVTTPFGPIYLPLILSQLFL